MQDVEGFGGGDAGDGFTEGFADTLVFGAVQEVGLYGILAQFEA